MIKEESNVTTLGVEVTDAGDEKAIKIVINGGREDLLVAASHLLIRLAEALSSEGDTGEQLTYLRALYDFTADEIRQKK